MGKFLFSKHNLVFDLIIYHIIHFSYLMIYKYIIVESDCQFDLRFYPFDHQHCHISLAYQGNQGEIIKLIPENLVYLGPTTMKQYQINKIEFDSNQDNKIKVAIKFS